MFTSSYLDSGGSPASEVLWVVQRNMVLWCLSKPLLPGITPRAKGLYFCAPYSLGTDY